MTQTPDISLEGIALQGFDRMLIVEAADSCDKSILEMHILGKYELNIFTYISAPELILTRPQSRHPSSQGAQKPRQVVVISPLWTF